MLFIQIVTSKTSSFFEEKKEALLRETSGLVHDWMAMTLHIQHFK